MASNGTLPFPSSPRQPFTCPSSSSAPEIWSDPSQPNSGSSTAFFPTSDMPAFQPQPVDNVQGHQPRPSVPSWNPAALLQPGRSSAKPAPSALNGSRPASRAGSVASSNDAVVFSFADSNGNGDVAQLEGSHADSGSSSEGHGVGSFVERVNNVQRRTLDHLPKRRKLDGQSPMDTGPARGSSGILGSYVTDKQKEANGSTTTVDLTDGGDDEAAKLNDPRDEEVCYGLVKTQLNCTRVPSPKPGTIRLGPAFSPVIKVVLRRDSSKNDTKIQAVDCTREIIGMVEHQSARTIVPLLDTNIQLRTDCRIPPHKSIPGENPGMPTSQAYNLDVIMYGPVRFAKNVGGHLAKNGLKLLAPGMVQRGIRVLNPHAIEYHPPPPREYPTNSQGAYVSTVNRTVEEIKSEVLGVFDSLTRNEDLPCMEPPSTITTPLLKHQKQGLYFMTMREKPRGTHIGERNMVSFWQQRPGPGGTKLFHNVITGSHLKQPPPETHGGILADMMGLGKTLSILSLVAMTTEAAQTWARQPPRQPVTLASRSKQDLPFDQGNVDLTALAQNTKTTLIVCPLSTVANWEEQMKQHLQPGTLSCHVYHGPHRIKDPARLAQFDIVITTYGSVSNELSSRRKQKEGLYPLEELGWFRIVLDEAHMIREQNTLQFKAICRLQAERRWAVTGTPVQNRLTDLAALLAFLRLHPFEDRGKFNRFIVEPFKACDPEIVPKMRILVDTITLRRLKDKIDLPPRDDLVIRLDFSPEERGIYELFAKNAKDRVKVLAGNKSGRALGGNSYIHILKSILRLRLLCAHGKDLLNDDDLDALQGMSAEMAIDLEDDDDGHEQPVLSKQKAREMLALMQDANGDICIDCGKELNPSDRSNEESEGQNSVVGHMTLCYHVVCAACIGGYQSRCQSLVLPGSQSGPCPECGEYIRYVFHDIRRTDLEVEHDGPAKSKTKNSAKKLERYTGPHTKTRALLEDLLKSKSASEKAPDEPPFKSVVFSGWTTHLDLIGRALDNNAIGYTRLDGSMSRAARTQAMDAFRDDDAVHVILVSIMAGGLGLNLTAGNSVYVMEPQYNPAAEAQAVDRVHRLGQKRAVRTVRYIMKDSFEEKMLELQDKKVKLASLSMDGQSKKLDKDEAARQKLMDIRSLFK